MENENERDEPTAESGVNNSDLFDVCAVYENMKRDLPYILDGIVSELGDTFIRPTSNDPVLAAMDAMSQLACVRELTGPLQSPLSLHAQQLREIRQAGDGILAARLYKERAEQEILLSHAQGDSQPPAKRL